ncbi:mannosyl-oligosaccharide alpha- [Plasmopara halstedii]|uniref:alpha-1,2-Mannosidase n=1 Tax=Plasmopara halstedii TaxID=4781 RepID=A0A0P1AE47_PLAHL|nr:mannosyl-oligosaccharide alpha- [Plasmopara halstedii]CEG38792.1 mannosyl-oligosaccharide alpha- [Plasmopara halstedii]|eukprot:XP_024575161.1 mannosyl-oligosaccharide alpha- [Plasmopara halstedii]
MNHATKVNSRLQRLQHWRYIRLLGGVCLLMLFLWVQYSILTTDISSNPVDLHSTTKSDHLRGNDHLGQRYKVDIATNDSTRGTAAWEELDKAIGMLADVEEPDKDVAAAPSAMQENRRLAVRKAMQFAWGNYEEHAFGGDELYPKRGSNHSQVWGDIACTLVDSIDTLWIMDLKDEFQRARDYVANHLDFSHLGRDENTVSVFETIIREVGGLLGAFDLSGDIIFKEKAVELMDRLTPAYNEKEGVFYTLYNPFTKAKSFNHFAAYRAHIADVGTLQLETRYLSDITGDSKYAQMGDAFYHIVKREGSHKKTGLFPVHFDSVSGKFDAQHSKLTLGALGDSFYEYLLKVYIYSAKRDEDKYLRELYDDAVRGIEEFLLFFSIPDDLYFLQDLNLPSLSAVRSMDHLTCFVPGMLALGTLFETDDHVKNAKHLELAEKLMETCYQLYRRQRTKLSPDIVSFPNMQATDQKHRLRPETIESLFYLYRATKNPKYREFGWNIFQALETHAKVKHGYAAILDVTEIPAQTEDKMESFFLAETLKYHYLLQAPESLIPLDEYVFNTEAHPLRIRKKKLN